MSRWWACFRKKERPVEYWDCSRLALTVLPKEVFKHRATITKLNMNANSIKDVPRAIFMFEVLEELDLSENDILFLPPSISQLSKLTVLNIRSNSLSNVPDEIQLCQNLVLLDLSSNPLGRLCDGVLELRQLRALLANDCSIEELPPNLGKLSRLETLELRENLLNGLPSSMCNMTLLEKLDLGVNEYQILPTVVGSLESLSELWLDSNTLSSLPEEIGSLRHLKFLELTENQLMLLPVTMDGLVNLTDLYLQDNLLTFLPETIGSLTKLNIVRLDNNRLSCLPDTIGGWTGLTELSVAHNHLSELPETIGGLQRLINLNLDENLISELPPEIGSCTSLKLLSIRNNELSELPAEMGQLDALSILNVIGNTLQYLPYALTRIKNLSALWIAENQSRPIMDLQMKRDDKGERWLTCYLLPQKGHESPINDGSSSSSREGEDQPARVLVVPHRTSVAFDPALEEKKSKLTRDLTPYPKELHLKAMQWRAARDAATGGSGEQNEHGHIQLRSPTRRFVNRPYSLLKALSDPLDENLLPVSGDQVVSSDSTSFPLIVEEPETPVSADQPVGRRSASLSPEVSSATQEVGGSTRQEVSGSSRVRTNVRRRGSNDTGRSRSQSPPTSSSNSVPPVSPLPPPVPSPPPIPSPSLLSSHTPVASSLILPPEGFSGYTPVRVQPNGGVRFQPHDPDEPETGKTISPDVEGDRIALLETANSNSNNTHDRTVHQVETVGWDGYINTGSQARELYLFELQRQQQRHRRQPAAPIEYYPSDVFHSDIPDPTPQYSSMESGFDADNELDSSAWYLSPDSSPKQRVARRPSDRHLTSSGSTTPHNPSQSQSDSDGYDHLPAHVAKGVSMATSKPHPRVTSGTKGGYSVTIPRATHTHSSSKAATAHVHSKGARSFDANETMRVSVQRTPPPSSPPPISPPPISPPPSHPHPHQKHTSHTMTAHKGNHARSFSQPDDLIGGNPGTGAAPRPRIFSDSSPAHPPPRHPSSRTSRSLHTSPAHLRHHRNINEDTNIYPFFQRRPEPITSDEAITQSRTAYPGHQSVRASGKKGVELTGRERHFSAEVGSKGRERSSAQRHHHSGRGVAGAKPWVSGHDSGFDSMNRPSHPSSPKRGSDNTPASFVTSPSGTVVEVELTKDPTLGMGITGGRDGENAIQSGDTGFFVCKLVEGKPAEKSGMVAIGDKLLEINGIDVSSLSLEEVSALLTGPDQQVILLLYKEPMVTLL